MAGTEFIKETFPQTAPQSSQAVVGTSHNVTQAKPTTDVAAGPAKTLAELALALAEFDSDTGGAAGATEAVQAVPVKPPQTEDQRVVEMLMTNARVLMTANEGRLAFNLLRNVLLRSPDHPEALKCMGICLRDAGRLDESLRCFRAYFKAEKSIEAQALVAESLYLAERDDMALAAYREILKKVVANQSLLFDIYKNVGNIHVRAGDFDAAEEFYDKAYTIQANSDVLLVNYGTLEIQRGNWGAAVERFRSAVEINPENDRAWVGLAMVHRTMGDLELGLANIERALDIRKGNRTALRLITDWTIQDHQISRAIGRLQDYVATEGAEDAEICFILSKLFVQAGRLTEARIELERVLALDPGTEGADELARVLDREIKKRSMLSEKN